MPRMLMTLVWCLFGTASFMWAQAPGLPLISSPSMGTGSRFFIEGDVEWATPKLSGNLEPRQFDKTFIPQINFGWNIAEAQAAILSYRYVDTQVTDVLNANVPDLESVVSRNFNLQTLDLIYRESLGGPGAPLGMDVDMGFRLVWANFSNDINATTIAGPLNTQQQLDFVTGGTRLGIRPYFVMDPTGWRMTLYVQGHIAYLWGTFHAQSSGDQVAAIDSRDTSTMWNWDAEAGFSMCVPGLEGVLQLAGGYRFEGWHADRFGVVSNSDKGSLTMHGPFLKLQFSF